MNFLNLRFENEYAGDIEKVYAELGRLSRKIKKGKSSLHDLD
jgi:hypothetical protein